MTAMQVDPAGLARQAKTVCQIGDDLRIAASTWSAAATGEFGLSTVDDAVAEVHEVWQKDFAVYQEVLAKWCEAAHAAAEGYQTVDEYQAAHLRVISPRNRAL
jgi:hypothetical protein